MIEIRDATAEAAPALAILMMDFQAVDSVDDCTANFSACRLPAERWQAPRRSRKYTADVVVH